MALSVEVVVGMVGRSLSATCTIPKARAQAATTMILALHPKFLAAILLVLGKLSHLRDSSCGCRSTVLIDKARTSHMNEWNVARCRAAHDNEYRVETCATYLKPVRHKRSRWRAEITPAPSSRMSSHSMTRFASGAQLSPNCVQKSATSRTSLEDLASKKNMAGPAPSSGEHESTQERLAALALDLVDLQQNDHGARSKQRISGSNILKLDIGGEKTVKTLRSTLTYASGSKLAEMFSGRWDESLPRYEDGSFFIDRKPELFLPLLEFWRDLNSMTPEDAKGALPPTAPSFADPKDERTFRRMVDSYDLTKVFHCYEVFRTGGTICTYNNRCFVSRNCSIFDCHLRDDHASWMYAFGPTSS